MRRDRSAESNQKSQRTYMKHRTLGLNLLILAILALGCDDSGPTAPDDELSTTFRGTFTPSTIGSGTCTLQIEAQPTGGITPYACVWSMSWINEASSARGYPDQCVLNISLPATFGPGLYPIDLAVRDRRNSDDHIARAGTDQEFDCSGPAQIPFFGS